MHKRTLRDYALLALFAALVYLPGLATHGVTNWQEGQRLVVAREMQLRGDWLLPTVHAQPYLAKPPLIYWCQIALAELRGGLVSLFDLRLTVALAGVLGVLATYWAGRQILDPSITPAVAQASRLCDRSVHDRCFARDASFWGAAMLATGFLSARSARIGELDILLIPTVALAVGGIAKAWRAHRERKATDLTAVTLAVLASCFAALAKGPPGLLVIALGAYGGIALHAANTTKPLDLQLFGDARVRRTPAAPPRSSPAQSAACPTTRHRLIAALFAAVLVCTAIVTGGGNERLGDLPGWLLHVVMAACVGAAFAGLFSPRRAWACFVAYSRTHPVAVLGLPLMVLWLWWHAATGQLSPEQKTLLLSQEAEDNLRLFVLGSPMRNLEAASYGVGLGSFAAIATLVWLVWHKPKLNAGWCIVLAWALLPIVAMSWLGKGVPRYLTPAWPGIALLGGLGVARLLQTKAHAAARLRTALGACVLALGAGTSLWYGYGREVFSAWRSPRDFLVEFELNIATLSPGRHAPAHDKLLLCSYEFQTPALDAYWGGTGRSVIPVGDVGVNDSMMGGPAWTLDELHAALRDLPDGAVVLVRETQPSGRPTPPPLDALRSAGFVVEEIPVSAEFRIDGGRTRIKAVVVRLP